MGITTSKWYLSKNVPIIGPDFPYCCLTFTKNNYISLLYGDRKINEQIQSSLLELYDQKVQVSKYSYPYQLWKIKDNNIDNDNNIFLIFKIITRICECGHELITTFSTPSIPKIKYNNPSTIHIANPIDISILKNNTNNNININNDNEINNHQHALANSYVFKWTQNATPIANVVALMFNGNGNNVSISLIAYPELPKGFIQYMYDIINNIWIKGEVPNLVITNKSHYIYYLEGYPWNDGKSREASILMSWTSAAILQNGYLPMPAITLGSNVYLPFYSDVLISSFVDIDPELTCLLNWQKDGKMTLTGSPRALDTSIYHFCDARFQRSDEMELFCEYDITKSYRDSNSNKQLTFFCDLTQHFDVSGWNLVFPNSILINGEDHGFILHTSESHPKYGMLCINFIFIKIKNRMVIDKIHIITSSGDITSLLLIIELAIQAAYPKLNIKKTTFPNAFEFSLCHATVNQNMLSNCSFALRLLDCLDGEGWELYFKYSNAFFFRPKLPPYRIPKPFIRDNIEKKIN